MNYLEPFKQVPIIGLGTIVVDHLIHLDRALQPGQKHEVLDGQFQVGGPVPTGLALLAKYGLECFFFGAWGEDNWGNYISEHLNAQKISFENNSKSQNETISSGFAHVWVQGESGERTISAYRGNGNPFLNPSHLESKQGILYLDGWPPENALQAAKLARLNNWKVFMDLGSPKPNHDELIAHTDWLNIPISFIRRAWGFTSVHDASEKILSMGPQEVTISDGENGSWYFSDRDQFHQPAIRVDAIDTNGAGDIFSAAQVYARSQGWEPIKMMHFASITAGLKCTRKGNVSSIPDLEKVMKFQFSEPFE